MLLIIGTISLLLNFFLYSFSLITALSPMMTLSDELILFPSSPFYIGLNFIVFLFFFFKTIKLALLFPIG